MTTVVLLGNLKRLIYEVEPGGLCEFHLYLVTDGLYLLFYGVGVPRSEFEFVPEALDKCNIVTSSLGESPDEFLASLIIVHLEHSLLPL